MNAVDNPEPGIGVARSLREADDLRAAPYGELVVLGVRELRCAGRLFRREDMVMGYPTTAGPSSRNSSCPCGSVTTTLTCIPFRTLAVTTQ